MEQWRKNYFVLLGGHAISLFSSSVLQFAIVWYINGVTQSPFILTMAMLVGFLPKALLGPFIGVFIDRFNRKSILILSDLFVAAVSLVPVLSAALFGSIPIWLIFFVLFFRAVGSAFYDPTFVTLTPQVAPKNELITCAGYSQALESISLIVSPAIAAALYAVWSLNQIILIDVIGAIIGVGTLLLVHVPDIKRDDTQVITPKDVVIEAKEGFSILRSKPGILGLVLISAIYSLALMPITPLFPIMCTAYFGGTESHAGAVEVVFAVGLLIGSFFLKLTKNVKNKVYVMGFSYVLMAISLISTAMLTPNQFYGFVVTAFFMGFSGPFYWGTFTPLLQQSFQEQHLGRVMALSSSIRSLSAPIAMSVAGIFSEIFGAQNWFLVSGILVLVATAVMFAVKDIRLAGITEKGESTSGLSV